MTEAQIRVTYPMRKLMLMIGLLGALACSQFDPQAAEDAILDITYAETEKLPSDAITLEIAIPREDSVTVDSNLLLTGLELATTLEAESVTVSFNKKQKEDTLEILGDSAEAQISREYAGVMTALVKSLEDGETHQITHDFSTLRLQYARFKDGEGWHLTRYSAAEERSDTNTYRITSLEIAGDVDAAVYYPDALQPPDSFPVLEPGDELTLKLETVADTGKLFCFALGAEPSRFLPKVDEEADDLWEAVVRMGEDPLMVGIIRKESLSDSTYPADLNVWVVPLSRGETSD